MQYPPTANPGSAEKTHIREVQLTDFAKTISPGSATHSTRSAVRPNNKPNRIQPQARFFNGTGENHDLFF